jgi:hypothetical protein
MMRKVYLRYHKAETECMKFMATFHEDVGNVVVQQRLDAPSRKIIGNGDYDYGQRSVSDRSLL